jgi:hypothetical protein
MPAPLAARALDIRIAAVHIVDQCLRWDFGYWSSQRAREQTRVVVVLRIVPWARTSTRFRRGTETATVEVRERFDQTLPGRAFTLTSTPG